MTSILIVEDNKLQREFLDRYFGEKGYACRAVFSISQATEVLNDGYPDLIIVDWMLQDESGLNWVKMLRGQGYNGWLIMLTARADIKSIQTGLNAGVDDYVSKPFRIRELASRVAVGLRRMAEIKQNQNLVYITIGDLIIDRENNRVLSSSNTPIPLTFFEYTLLLKLGLNFPDLVSREDLVFDLWGNLYSDSYNALQNVIYRIRKKLADGDIVKTSIRSQYSKGYSLSQK